MSEISLRLGDCLELMREIPDASVDAVIADIPYGTTACSWDTVIPFAPMWEHLKRLAKPKAAIVLFGSQPFTSALVMSNPQMFKYELVWHKRRATTPGLARIRPMSVHESMIVFGDGTLCYHPQMQAGKPYKGFQSGSRIKNERRLGYKKNMHVANNGTRYPLSVVEIPAGSPTNTIHPTQKPVALMEYLIRTYTNEGDTVLDFTMGSGSTMVACVNTNRNGIGIELRQDYFEIAQRRIAEAQAQLTLNFGAAA